MSLLLTHCSVNDSPDCVFDSWVRTKEQLDIHEVHKYYGRLRYGGVSLNQVRAAVQSVCSLDTCSRDEFTELLGELDRRYALVQDVRWEFNMLAEQYGGAITEDDAIFLFKAVHDGYDWRSCWREFVSSRGERMGTRITWDEIEVSLCAQPSLEDDPEQSLFIYKNYHHCKIHIVLLILTICQYTISSISVERIGYWRVKDFYYHALRGVLIQGCYVYLHYHIGVVSKYL